MYVFEGQLLGFFTAFCLLRILTLSSTAVSCLPFTTRQHLPGLSTTTTEMEYHSRFTTMSNNTTNGQIYYTGRKDSSAETTTSGRILNNAGTDVPETTIRHHTADVRTLHKATQYQNHVSTHENTNTPVIVTSNVKANINWNTPETKVNSEINTVSRVVSATVVTSDTADKHVVNDRYNMTPDHYKDTSKSSTTTASPISLNNANRTLHGHTAVSNATKFTPTAENVNGTELPSTINDTHVLTLYGMIVNETNVILTTEYSKRTALPTALSDSDVTASLNVFMVTESTTVRPASNVKDITPFTTRLSTSNRSIADMKPALSEIPTHSTDVTTVSGETTPHSATMATSSPRRVSLEQFQSHQPNTQALPRNNTSSQPLGATAFAFGNPAMPKRIRRPRKRKPK